MILGLTGKIGSGKTEIAKYLGEQYGFTRLSFATPLKIACYGIFDLSQEQMFGDLKEVIDTRWNLTPRFIMQQMGTEVCRAIHPNTWVMHLERNLKLLSEELEISIIDLNVVIDDVRFTNEADMLLDKGAIIMKVIRSSYEETQSAFEEHISEWEQDSIQVNHLFLNNGDLDDLKHFVDIMIETNKENQYE